MNKLVDRLPLKHQEKTNEARSGESARSKSVFREYAEAIVLAVILALFIRTFVVQAFKIPSGSMEKTLLIGDYILVMKSIYGIRMPWTNKVIIPIKDPKHGDVIVFAYPRDPSKDFIKRVIGVPGDKVELRNKKLYINGQPTKDEYAHYDDPSIYPMMVQPRDDFGPIVVPENKLFVLGDNRDKSSDSRVWGFVDMDAVRGKAILVYISWDGWRIRWDRIGKIVH